MQWVIVQQDQIRDKKFNANKYHIHCVRESKSKHFKNTADRVIFWKRTNKRSGPNSKSKSKQRVTFNPCDQSFDPDQAHGHVTKHHIYPPTHFLNDIKTYSQIKSEHRPPPQWPITDNSPSQKHKMSPPPFTHNVRPSLESLPISLGGEHRECRGRLRPSTLCPVPFALLLLCRCCRRLFLLFLELFQFVQLPLLCLKRLLRAIHIPGTRTRARAHIHSVMHCSAAIHILPLPLAILLLLHLLLLV